VWTVVGFGLWWRVVPIPALVVLGFWIVVQVLNGLITFGSGEPGGVAFLAHVGGFVIGMALVGVFRQRPRVTYRRW
jgi:membrane associated rhomboid family serine protease